MKTVNPNMKKWIVNGFFVAVFLGIFILFAKIILPFITPIVLAILLGAVFFPLYKKVLKSTKGRARVASAIMCVLIVLIVVLPFIGFLGILSKEAFDFYISTRERIDTGYYGQLIDQNIWIYERAAGFLEGVNIQTDFDSQRDTLLNAGKNVAFYVYDQAGNFLGNIVQAVFFFIAIIFILYYLFKDHKVIAKTLMDLSPLPDHLELKLVKRVAVVGKAVVFGNMITAFVQGVLGGIGFLAFGLGNSIFWGTVIGIASLIPSVGVFVVAIPASLIFFVQGKVWIGIGFLAYNLLIVGSVDNIMKPKLIESKINLHPLLVFLGVLGGMIAFGPLGIIYGPLIVTLFVSFLSIYKDYFRDGEFHEEPNRKQSQLVKTKA
ncbi:AI-2E family transporter [Patescibacteria group bacterium]|nr:AI-2E family transporter [Patescibacteria group bacterium]